ncbi:MAG TPA: hypothetical protein VF889_08190 [Bacteroidota bacterium]
MHRHTRRFMVLLVLALAGRPLPAQTTINPDISIIPRFLIESNDGEKLPQGIREFSRPDFQFQELELAIQAYLNPFARGDVILTVPGPDVENARLGIEEAYASVLRGLPLDLNMRIGKYRAEFGKLNMVHPHAWSFITQPLEQARFLGEDGLNDLGISASLLLPTGDVYSKLTVDLLRGLSIKNGPGLPDTTGARPYYATSGRLMGFFTLSDFSDMEVGLSALTGIHDPYTRDRFWYFNGDLKYKYRPSSYTALTLQAEYLYNTRTITAGPAPGTAASATVSTVNTGGLYAFADYQFFKIFNTGLRYDWSEAPYSASDKARGFSLWFGYYPVEETLGLRFEYQHTVTDTPAGSQAVNLLALQVLFSMGPHKAHPF